MLPRQHTLPETCLLLQTDCTALVERQPLLAGVHRHRVARPELTGQNPPRQRIFQRLLDRPLERPRAVDRIEPALLRCSYNHLIFMSLFLLLGTVLDEISP